MKHTPDLAFIVLEAISERPYGLMQICAELSAEHKIKLHKRDVLRWKDPESPYFVEGFEKRYREAKKEQARMSADEMIQIADTALIGKIVKIYPDGKEEIQIKDNVERSKLMVHARQFNATRLLPEYMEKHTVTGDESGGPVRFVLERIGEKKEKS